MNNAFSRASAAGGAKASRDVLLQPGDHFVGDCSQRLRTVLGSCVSVTLWSERHRVGAMSHFLLAGRSGAGADRLGEHHSERFALDGRYGDEAIALMLHGLSLLGVSAAHCKAKIFGGGNMFPNQGVPGSPAIGRRNGEAARSLLRARGMEVHSESLFGEGHRQIIFEIATGDVWVRQLPLAADEIPSIAGHA